MKLRTEKKKELEPNRMDYAEKELTKIGCEFNKASDGKIEIMHNGSPISFWPYTGWHSGKTITDGRGIHKLLKQLKQK